MIRDAELGSVEPEGKDKVYINHLLVDGVLFIAWYAKFVENWRPKQYLLDAKSIENCKALHNFLYPLGSIATEPLIRAEVLPLSVKFRSLLFACHESLEEYLLQGIEDA